MDYSLPGASVHAIFQARILEQVATSFCRDLPDLGIEPTYLASPVLTGGFFSIWITGEAPVYSLTSVQLLSHVRLFVTPRTAARQASLSITNSRSLLMSIELVMPFSHLILCSPLLLPPSIFPSIRVFSNESVLHIRWPKWEFQLQHHSFQWIFRTDFLYNWLVLSPFSPRDSQESSPTQQFKSINFSAVSFLYNQL